MTVLFVDRKGLNLKVNGNVLIFYNETERFATVPLKILERICIRGDLQLSTSVLGKLGEHGVGVLVLSGRMKKPVLMMPAWKVDGKRRVAQFSATQNPDFCLNIARQWVSQKIQGQLSLLSNWVKKKPLLHDECSVLISLTGHINTASDLKTLRGLEGIAAAHYFKSLAKLLPASLNFHGRNRRPPRDAFNVVLSLGYTMLHFELVRQIYLIGLDPFVGFYHTVAHGRESLASDLLEPMRPIYDAWAISLFHQGTLRPEDFSVRTDHCEMKKAGRLRFYQAYEVAAKQWRPAMRASTVELLHGLSKNSDNEWIPSEYRVLEN